MPKYETAFVSADMVGRRASYVPGTVLPSETSVPPYFGARLSSEQLSAEGGETFKLGAEAYRWDGRGLVRQEG